MKPRTTILLADDHEIVRMGLASLIGTKKDLEVVGEAEDGEAAVRKAIRLKPDVVVMDLMMPRKDGASATAEIRQHIPATKVLVLTSYGTADGIAHALAAGANGALMKSTEFSVLVSAIRTIAAGGHVVAPEIERQLVEDPPVPELTSRQLEVLHSIMRGLTNAEIAMQLGIREDSVKEHVNAIFEKLCASNRSEAVTIAMRKHIVTA